jgi:cell division protein FtsA
MDQVLTLENQGNGMEENTQKTKRMVLGGEIVAALDIGSTKVCCAIGRLEADKGIRILGFGYQLSKGFKAGTITNMEELENAILNAVSIAEQMAGVSIGEIYLNLSGNHIQSELIAVDHPLGPEGVDDEILRNVQSMGWLGRKQNGRDLIYAVPINYDLDDQLNISDPGGMFGRILRARVHLITGQSNILRNLVVCINRCQLDITGVAFSAYASGESVLIEDEKELGGLVIDLGGGTTSCAYFENGRVVWTDSIMVGSKHITHDIARVLVTPVAQAERLKTLYGGATIAKSDEKEVISVSQVSENGLSSIQIPRSALISIIQPRLEEMFEMVKQRISAAGLDRILHQRIILTGGGSQLPGIRDLCIQNLGKHVRLGKPMNILGLSETSGGPAFATCAGLLHQALHYGSARHTKLLSPTLSFLERLKSFFMRKAG